MAKTMSYIVCPVCTRNLSLIRRGRERRKYNLWTKNQPIIYIRDCSGGKKPHTPSLEKRKPGWPPGSGFPIIQKIGWNEALAIEEYRGPLEEIKEQIIKLAKEILNQNEKQKLLKALSNQE